MEVTVNDHLLYHEVLVGEGGDSAAVLSRELGGRVEDGEGAEDGGVVVGGAVLEVETAAQHSEILRTLTGYPLVDRRRPVVEEPLDYEAGVGLEVDGSQRVLTVEDDEAGVVDDERRHQERGDLQRTAFQPCVCNMTSQQNNNLHRITIA